MANDLKQYETGSPILYVSGTGTTVNDELEGLAKTSKDFCASSNLPMVAVAGYLSQNISDISISSDDRAQSSTTASEAAVSNAQLLVENPAQDSTANTNGASLLTLMSHAGNAPQVTSSSGSFRVPLSALAGSSTFDVSSGVSCSFNPVVETSTVVSSNHSLTADTTTVTITESPACSTFVSREGTLNVSRSPADTASGYRQTYKDLKASIADRRSSFFNEVTKSPALPPRSASQYHVPRPNSQPINLVLERTKKFQLAEAKTPSITEPTLFGVPTFGCDAVSQQAAAYDRKIRAAEKTLGDQFGGIASMKIDSIVENVSQTNPLGSENVGSMPATFSRQLQVSPTCQSHGLPRPYVSGSRGDTYGKTGMITEKNVAPMRTVNSTGNLDDRINSAKLQACAAGNTSMSDQLLVTPNSAPQLQATVERTEEDRRKHFFSDPTDKSSIARDVSSHAFDDLPNDVFDGNKLDVCSKVDNQLSYGVKPSVSPDVAKGAAASGDKYSMSKQKKPPHWSLANKMHGTHSPNARTKKPANDQKEPTSLSPKQKESWKGKVARTFKRYGSGSVLSPSAEAMPAHAPEVAGAFGVPLEFCQPSNFCEFVPSIVEICTRVVEEKGILNQGIYRVPGNTGLINQLVEELNKDPVGLCMDSDKWQDVNLVSSLLKLFFRKLPDSLITDYLYESVIAANRTENSERRMLKLKKLLHELPEHNFETFHYMAQHLNKITMHEDINKMDAHNLAIMFGPTLVRPQDDNMIVMVKDMAGQCRVVESIIVHCDWFFSSWDEDVNVPVDDESEDSSVSTMNQELLAKAESLALTQSSFNAPRDLARYKELVSTIFSAANRRIRHREKGRQGSGSTGDLTQEPLEGGGSHEIKNDPASTTGSEYFSDTAEGKEFMLCQTSVVSSSSGSGRQHGVSFEASSRYTTCESNSKPCLRRTHSTESLLSPQPSSSASFYPDFSMRLAPTRFQLPYSVPAAAPVPQLSPQLLCQLHLKRQMLAKQQFMQHQPQQRSEQLLQQSCDSSEMSRSSQEQSFSRTTVMVKNDGSQISEDKKQDT